MTALETYAVACAFALGLPIALGGLITGLRFRREVQPAVKANITGFSITFAFLSALVALVAGCANCQSIIAFSSCVSVFQCSIFGVFLAVGLWIRNYRYS